MCDVQVYWYRSLPTWRLIRVGKVLYVSAFDSGWEAYADMVMLRNATQAAGLNPTASTDEEFFIGRNPL